VARSIAWTSALETGDPEAAIALAERGLATDPLDEEAGRVAMLGHRAAGRRTHAISAYQRLRTALSEELGVDPAPETRELHGDIVDETEATRPGPRPGRHAAVERPEPLDPAFVGRQAEIRLAAEAWSAAAGGETTLVLLVGEAGMGKTTVGTRVASLARSTGGLVLEARCYEAERSLFLQPIADAIRPLVLRSSAATLRALNADGGIGLARLSPELSAAIGTPIPEPTIPELERRRAFDAAADLIRSLAGRQPVLLYLDDLHLAGAATTEFLHYLVRRAAPSRLLVLGSLRVEEGDDVRRALGELARTIEVGALPAEAVRRLAATMGNEGVGDDFVELTRGHPLFVVEMLRALAERPATDASGTRTPIPDTLRAAVLERVERAGQDVADLLAAAAIIGSTFDLGVVAALLDLPLEEAIRRG
jgi:predicted ATPase